MATEDDALANNRDVFAKTLRMEETQFGREDPRLAERMGLLVVPVTAFVTWCLFGIQEIGLFIKHCALDDGAIFMDQIADDVALDIDPAGGILHKLEELCGVLGIP